MDEFETLGLIVPQYNVPTTPTRDGSTFNNIANGISNLFTSAAPIVQAVVPNRGINPSANTPIYQLPSGGGASMPSAPAPEKKSNMLKYVAIAAVVGVVGFVGYKIATKKKKGLGDITATTKAGKSAQRKAIFARLSEDGIKPKKRKKSRKVKKARI